jgi:hypothetical protein
LLKLTEKLLVRNKTKHKGVYKITGVPVLVGQESENKHNKRRTKPNSFSRNGMHFSVQDMNRLDRKRITKMPPLQE